MASAKEITITTPWTVWMALELATICGMCDFIAVEIGK